MTYVVKSQEYVVKSQENHFYVFHSDSIKRFFKVSMSPLVRRILCFLFPTPYCYHSSTLKVIDCFYNVSMLFPYSTWPYSTGPYWGLCSMTRTPRTEPQAATPTWTTPSVAGTNPTARYRHTGVMDARGKMWIFAGIDSSKSLGICSLCVR